MFTLYKLKTGPSRQEWARTTSLSTEFSDILSKLKDNRDEDKLKGDAFEHWTVLHSDISYGHKSSRTRRTWNLKTWRSDKTVRVNEDILLMPDESTDPDLEFESNSLYVMEDGAMRPVRIAVECKYRTTANIDGAASTVRTFIKNNFKRAIKEYTEYSMKRNPDLVLIVLGLGSDTKCGLRLERVLVFSLETAKELLKITTIKDEGEEIKAIRQFLDNPLYRHDLSDKFLDYEKYLRLFTECSIKDYPENVPSH